MPKKNLKPLDSLNALDAGKESKKRAEEFAEEIAVLGQDSEEQAAKWVIEKGEEERKKQDEENYYTQEKLAKRKGSLYWDSIRNEARKRIASFDIPKGYTIDCVITSKGIAFGWKHYSRNVWYMKGMKVSESPVHDLQMVDRLISQALDEIERISAGQDIEHKSGGGIVLPN